jgi:hypothetical protein
MAPESLGIFSCEGEVLGLNFAVPLTASGQQRHKGRA